MMSRSPSEYAFQRFLQEQEATASVDHNSSPSQNDVVEVSDKGLRTDRNVKSVTDSAKTTSLGEVDVPIRSEDDYQAFLKSRLYLACAAVAFSRGNCMEPQDSAAMLPDKGLEAAISNPKGSGNDFLKGQEKNAVGTPTLPAVQNISSARVLSASGSEPSDDDEAETSHQMDSKRTRRMLSNRESARRSRRRKQVHQTELETQVSQLKVENSSLLKRFTEVSQKHNDSAVDNRILKADVETLRAKVKMAEETVKRITGMHSSLFQTMPDISSPASNNTSVADDHYYQSIHRVASLENLQSRMRTEAARASFTTQTDLI